MKENGLGKRILACVMMGMMIFTYMPQIAFATDFGVNTEEKKTVTLDDMTPEILFDAIKGENESMDKITGNLLDYGNVVKESGAENYSGCKFFGSLKNGKLELDDNGWEKDYRFNWIKSSDPEYISVNKNINGLNLLKRPAIGENPKKVTLTIEVTLQSNTDLKKRMDLELTILPGEKIKSNLEKLEDGFIDLIKGDNKDADNIKSDFGTTGKVDDNINANALTYYFKLSDGSKIASAGKFYYHYRVVVKESSNPEVIKVDLENKKLAVTRPTGKDAEVKLTCDVEDKQGESKTVQMPVIVKANSVIDKIDEDMLFDMIKGENADKDHVDKDFNIQLQNEFPTYIKSFDENNKPKWWSGPMDVLAKIEFVKSSHPEIIDKKTKEGYELTKLNRPAEDTEVTLTFKITDWNTKATEEKDLKITVLKDDKKIDFEQLIKDSVFDHIKGTNSDQNNIKSNLVYKNPFFAAYDGEKMVYTDEKTEDSKYQIQINKPDVNFVKAVNTGLEIVTALDQDQRVDLPFEVKNLENKEVKQLDIPVIFKAKSAKEKEMQALLDEYFVPEKFEYTVDKQHDFLTDYKNGNVRSIFKVPSIKNEAKLGYSDYTAKVVSEDNEHLKNKVTHVFDPFRPDVGKEPVKVKLTYTLEYNKTHEKASKTIEITIPPLTEKEIEDEYKLMQDVEKNLFDGINDQNYDKDNVSKAFKNKIYDAYYGEDGKVVFAKDSKSRKNLGFETPANEAWEITYLDGFTGERLFDPVGMDIQYRPDRDVKTRISFNIQSINLEKYAEKYTDNELLQKIKKHKVHVDVIVKKVDGSVNSFEIDNKQIPVVEDVTAYSLLTDKTLEKATVKANLQNKNSELVIDGDDKTHKFVKEVKLTNGFKKFSVSSKDENNKEQGDVSVNNYTISIVSKPYLEDGIKSLPANPKDAKKADLDKAKELYIQYDSLTDLDKAKIEGADKLAKYHDAIGDIKAQSKKDVELAAKNLFDGIKGKNPSADMVYTDMNEVYFAKVDGDKVTYTKEAANGSNVRIDWIESNVPDMINVHAGNDFETRYKPAFEINKRPLAGNSPIDVVFTAKLTHLVDTDVTKETEVNFKLNEYNASLDSLKIKELPKFKFKSDVYEYTVEKTSDLKKATLEFVKHIPGAEVRINGKKIKDANEATVKLDNDVDVITIHVNDQIVNTYDSKWDEKTYKITVMTSVDDLIKAIKALPKTEDLKADNYKEYVDRINALCDAYESLSEELKAQVGNDNKAILDAAKERIDKLALDEVKAEYANELKEYRSNPNEFTTENWAKIEEFRAQGLKDIEEAIDKNGVISGYNAARKLITSMPLKDLGAAAKNTDIKFIKASPGGELAKLDTADSYKLSVGKTMSKILLEIKPDSDNAVVRVNGEELTRETGFTIKKPVDLTKGKTVTITVVSPDKTAEKTYTLNIENDIDDTENTVRVSFKLIGDTKHGENNHVAFEDWLEKSVSVPENSSVKYIFDKLMLENNIDFIVLGGNYVSSINGLAEKDNGPNSGWVYSVNGVYPDKTYDQYKVKEGDDIIFRYTDDYKQDNIPMGGDEDNNPTNPDTPDTNVVNKWQKADNGKWSYIGADGKLIKGKTAEINGNTYNFDKDGVMTTGWLKENGTWYYFNEKGNGTEGAMAKNSWKKVNGKWYYFYEDGKMASKTWEKIGGNWYYFYGGGSMAADTMVGNYYVNKSGAWRTDKWVKTSSGKYWYYYKEGNYPKNEVADINGISYHFDNSGWMTTGWLKNNGTWYYFNKKGEGTEGAMVKSSWKKINGKWYYFYEDGKMASKTWEKIGGNWYYFYGGGSMAANTMVGKYYVNKSGAWRIDKWVKTSSGKYWYYFKEGGYPKNRFLDISGNSYYFDNGGWMKTGWLKNNGTWYYFNKKGEGTEGAMVKSSWKKVNGKWYYFYGNGKMAKNTTINGWRVNSSGAWVR